MTYLLDTCVISEAMKKRPDPDDMTLVTRNVAALAEASRLPEEEWPLPVQPDYPSEVRNAADRAHDYLVARGEELHIDPALFANRAQLLAFVDDPEVPDNPLAEGWRFETAGRTIIERFYVP